MPGGESGVVQNSERVGRLVAAVVFSSGRPLAIRWVVLQVGAGDTDKDASDTILNLCDERAA